MQVVGFADVVLIERRRFRAGGDEGAALHHAIAVDRIRQARIDARGWQVGGAIGRGGARAVEPRFVRISQAGIVFARIEPVQVGRDAVGQLGGDAQRRADGGAVVVDIAEIGQLRFDIAARKRHIIGGAQRLTGGRHGAVIGDRPLIAVGVLEFRSLGLLMVVGEAGGHRHLIVEIVGADQRADRGPVVLALIHRHAEIAAQRPADRLLQRVAGLQIDGAAQAAFGDRGLGVLIDVDAADFLGRNTFQRAILRAAAGATARAFARDIEFLAGQEDVAIQGGQILAQAVDQHRGADALRAVDLYAGQALKGLGDVLVGHLADIFRCDRFDRQVGVTLIVEGFLLGGAETGDHDFLDIAARSGRLLGEHRAGDQKGES